MVCSTRPLPPARRSCSRWSRHRAGDTEDLADLRAAGPTPQPGGFRFHLPITGSLDLVDAPTQALVLDAAQQFFSDLPILHFNSLALFAEPTPGADFVLLDHLEMLP